MPFDVLPLPKLPTKDLLSWIFDNPTYDIDRPIYIDATDPSRSISNRQSRQIIRKLIAGLRHAGVRKGDCVLIHAMGDIYYPLLFLAIIGSGAIYAGSNPAYTPHELTHHVRVTETKFILCGGEFIQSMAAVAKETGIAQSNIRIFNPDPQQSTPAGFQSWTDLMEHGEDDWVRFDDLDTCARTTAARLTSSGTTGLPKATITSHYNYIAQHEMLYGVAGKPRDYHTVNLFALPMFHAAVGPRVHTTVLKNGQTTYIMRRFELEPFLANIEKYRVTDLYLVSPMVVAIVMSPLVTKYNLTSIKCALAGAAPLSKESQAAMRQYLSPGAPVTQGMGMTESTCIMMWIDWPEDDTTGSVGRLRPGIEAKLVDDDNKDISGYDTVGELCIRGPTVIKAYFKNPAANKASFDDEGYFHTGDIMYCDKQTKLWYIVDRKKELIKVRGFQVAPPEIEGLLLTHPKIVDAAVIGVPAPSKVDGEFPRAYVVRRPGVAAKDLTEQDVYDFTSAKLAKFKRLDGGVRFTDVIPKNASGKILKRILREEVKKEQAGKL